MFDIKHKSTIKIELKRAARVYLRIRPPINFISRKVHFITYTWARKKQHRNPDDKRLNRPGSGQYIGRNIAQRLMHTHVRCISVCACMAQIATLEKSAVRNSRARARFAKAHISRAASFQ